MIHILICDDEKALRSDLKKITQTCLQLKGLNYRISEFSSGEELLGDFQEKQDQQILFLDIEMSGISGMETARQLRRRDASLIIIFVTSYPDFVFQGYEVKALNYILKPYDRKKIELVLDDAIESLDAQIDSCFLLEQRGSMIRLPFKDIHYFFSRRHEVFVITSDGEFSFYGKLNDLPPRLPDCFVRIHSRYLINLQHLKSLSKDQAVMDKDTLPVSRSCKQEAFAAYARYLLT